jgi:hypothetical protein
MNNTVTRTRYYRPAGSRNRAFISAVFAGLLAISITFSACNVPIISDIIDHVTVREPDAASTVTSRPEAIDKIIAAVTAGDDSITLDIVCSEYEAESFVKDFDPFFGGPNAYRVEKTFDDVILHEGDSPVFVSRVLYQLEQSANWYVLKLLEDPSYAIPEDVSSDISKAATALADKLPTITKKIFGKEGPDKDLSSYELVLMTHDWLVANIEYDEKMTATSSDNSAYGALIDKKTICQGYSEALELILRYATDVPVRMEIGEGDSGDGYWVGHAWNLVQLDGTWYHIDTTFDDQIGNKKGKVDHYYFGQNDKVMKNDHKWETELWPECDGKSYLYYRTAKLYTKSLDDARTVIRKQLEAGPKKNSSSINIEFVADGYEIDGNDLQFIYREYPDVEDVYKASVAIGSKDVINLRIDY